MALLVGDAWRRRLTLLVGTGSARTGPERQTLTLRFSPATGRHVWSWADGRPEAAAAAAAEQAGCWRGETRCRVKSSGGAGGLLPGTGVAASERQAGTHSCFCTAAAKEWQLTLAGPRPAEPAASHEAGTVVHTLTSVGRLWCAEGCPVARARPTPPHISCAVADRRRLHRGGRPATQHRTPVEPEPAQEWHAGALSAAATHSCSSHRAHLLWWSITVGLRLHWIAWCRRQSGGRARTRRSGARQRWPSRSGRPVSESWRGGWSSLRSRCPA